MSGSLKPGSVRSAAHLPGVAFLASAALALSGCGGGGSTAVQGGTAYGLANALGKLVTQGFSVSVTLSGSLPINGVATTVTGSGTLTYGAGASGTFNGAAALLQDQTLSGSVTAAGQTDPYTTSVTDYYATGNDAFLGEVNNTANGAEYDVAQSPIVYPATVVDGSSGALGTVSRYTDSTMSVALGTAQVSYSVKTDSTSSGSVIVELKELVYDTQNRLLETDLTDYALSTNDVLSLVSASVQTTNNGTLTATAQ